MHLVELMRRSIYIYVLKRISLYTSCRGDLYICLLEEISLYNL